MSHRVHSIKRFLFKEEEEKKEMPKTYPNAFEFQKCKKKQEKAKSNKQKMIEMRKIEQKFQSPLIRTFSICSLS